MSIVGVKYTGPSSHVNLHVQAANDEKKVSPPKFAAWSRAAENDHLGFLFFF